jgi:hypothetical protein
VSRQVQPPRRLARDRKHDLQPLRRQAPRHAVGPLHETDTAGLEVFVCAKIVECCLAGEPIGVEVVDRQPGVVLLDQHKCRTADDARVRDIESFRDRTHEARLAGPERPDQRDDRAREYRLTEAAAERLGVGKGVQVKRRRKCHR